MIPENLLCGIIDSTQIVYDLMNQEIKRTERDGSVTRQFYDAEGQLIKVIRPNEYQYGSLLRL